LIRIFLKLLLSLIFIFFSCDKHEKKFIRFEDESGLIFENNLEYTENLNPYTYRNFYNGAGVALGDINNDGLIDVYFTGNIVDNKLFLNKGNFKFEDITSSAGVACSNVWSTGATFADINGDGFLDIYVCKSGPPGGKNRNNELFINNGDLTFTEKSIDYNLDVTGLSVHSAFFDYDKDGDLDCYILNNSFRNVGGYDLIEGQRKIPDPDGQGNKFFENVGNKFIDVTQKVNIFSSNIGFGLGITLSDFNNDGWTDLFISNDFFEKDYLYINNKDKTFSENSSKYFKSMSLGSMGADSADLDNDLLTDLFVTEMLPKSLERKKTKAVYDSWDKHQLAVSKGYYYQYPRNVLQRNYGDSGFLEIGRYSNLAATEWSWASMIFDMDNDGLRDIFIANGIFKDLLDRDYLAYMANEERISSLMKSGGEVIKKLIDIMPSKAVKNNIYKNNGDFDFTEFTDQWGFDTPSFSNGMAFGDLDNDGDQDIVINNVNMKSFVYNNQNNNQKSKSISFKLKGVDKNKNAIGAKLTIYYGDGKSSISEHFPSRGFQSSISNKIHFGVGDIDEIDSLIINWPNQEISKLYDLKTNKTHDIDQQSSLKFNKPNLSSQKTKKILKQINILYHRHVENKFVDFNKERLVPQMFSNEGPTITSSDLNNDNLPDFFIGSSKDQLSSLFLSNGLSYKKTVKPFDINKKSEDTDAVFFDSDNDGDDDLYVSSGGKSFSRYDSNLNDRLYVNEGNGKFKLSNSSFLFDRPFSTGVVAVGDYNNDSLVDIFVGERFDVDSYGIPVSGRLYKNLGNNKFENIKINSFENIGLITSAKWVDINFDDNLDLIVSGEWMPIKVFINIDGDFIDRTKEYGLENSNGLWNDIEIVDIDSDGDFDIVAANYGENNFYKPNMKMFVNDFDLNGFKEQIICYEIDGKNYPILDKDELIGQLPGIKKKIVYYKDYSNLSIDQIFNQETFESSTVLNLNTLQSSVFINNNGKFLQTPMPPEINYSSMYDIELVEKNKGGIKIVVGGNQYNIKPQFGRQDASKGYFLNIEISNDSISYSNLESLNIEGQIRNFELFNLKNIKSIAVGINNEKTKFFEYN
jgi:hypothetical protein